MVSAIRLAAKFLEALPQDRLQPELTEGREGFLHPVTIEGGVPEVRMMFILRDFQTHVLADHAALLEDIAGKLMQRYPQAHITVKVERQYRNMADGLKKEPRALAYAEKAMRKAGFQPVFKSLRGGTDGSRLTELGLPTPNLSTGEHNPHSPLEWTALEDMEAACKVLVELAQVWGQEKA
jgi:tripeptide aminopeptidase